MRLSLAVALAFAAIVNAGCSLFEGPRRARHEVSELADRLRAVEERLVVQEAELARLRTAGPGAPAAAPPPPVAGPDREASPGLAALPPAPALPAIEVSDLEDLAPVAVAEPRELPAGIGAEAQTAYDAAFALYQRGIFGEVEPAFSAFLARYPESALADNAEFWIGAARMKRGDPAGAEAAFRRVVEAYPDGNKVPDALFQLGQCREAAGDLAGARVAYEALLAHHAGSEPAERATDRLRTLALAR